jgi:hypothetical protein
MLFRVYLEPSITGTFSFVHNVYIKITQSIVFTIKTNKMRNIVGYINTKIC